MTWSPTHRYSVADPPAVVKPSETALRPYSMGLKGCRGPRARCRPACFLGDLHRGPGMTGSLVRSHLSPAYPSRHSISRSTRNPLEDTAGASTSLVWPPQKFLSVFERTGLHRRGEVTPGYGGHWELDYWQSDTCFLSFERHTSSLPNPRRRRRHRSFQPSRAAPGGFLAPCRNVPAQ